MSTVVAIKTFPVIETFGPTVQGEGALAGLPTHFIRFGGCDYRCEWCDSLYAVLPAEVRANATKLTAGQIVDALVGLGGDPKWVTISGGNPALLDLAEVVDELHQRGFRVAVETQASVWKDWLLNVEMLTVSPKPPSSGMATSAHSVQTGRFLARACELTPDRRSLKIVVFDDGDYLWAREMILARREVGEVWDEYLSVGTDPPGDMEPPEYTLTKIAGRYRWLCEQVVGDPLMPKDVRVLPQLHVLAWLHARGV